MPTADRIMTTFVDTTALPAGRQFESWAAHTRTVRAAPAGGPGFVARGAYWSLGPVVVTCTQLDAFTTERDAAIIAAEPVDHVHVIALLEGTTLFEADGVREECRAPDLFLLDYTRPYRTTVSRVFFVNAYLARHFLEEATGPLRVHGRLPRSVEADLFAAFLRTLVQTLPYAAARSSAVYARMVRDGLAAALLSGQDEAAGTTGLDRRQRAIRYMATQPPGSVTVETMGRALGIGRSTLYRLFRQEGGVLAYDRMRRLRNLYRDVADPSEHRQLAALGAEHGFFDPATLARSFRLTFGFSLTELRRRTRDSAVAPAQADDVIDHLRHSIRMLGTA